MKSLLLALIVASAFSAAAASADNDSSNLRGAAEVQMEWIRSHGGFISPKIELVNTTSSLAFLVKELVEKDETLMVIPRACLITSEGTFDECDTAWNLVQQRKLGNESKYAPYLDFIFDVSHDDGLIPSTWSSRGKQLLTRIIGRELPPHDVTSISFQEYCGGRGSGDDDALLEEQAHRIVISKSWDDVMIPVLEMVQHRNGKWTNIHTNRIHESDDDIAVFASRDIQAGEELYQSYNECTDCDYELEYALPDMLKDRGFVELYPRRWRFGQHASDLVFELDETDDHSDKLKLTWLTEKPNEDDIKFLRGHLVRLKNLNDHVLEQASLIDSSHERDVSLEYYQALMTALEYAIWYPDDDNEVSNEFDALDSVTEKMEFNEMVCDYGHARHDENEDSTFELVDDMESFYQSINFAYSAELKDTCLYMDHYLHTCMSWRPHYHEYLVHYPARYLDQVKRVAFIGGGDNMIVHEILKYPSVELVVGLELDQMVVRSSFKNMGTQPHLDDERVQWWFGDATTSLLMLPQEYYGTFDLVLIDLAQEVVEMLNVTKELDINDAAMHLLKKDGVVARNEDWNFGTSKPFAEYTVDLYYVDVPMTCHQSITLASNGVDFLSKTPKDHDIETVYLKSVEEIEDRFHFWYNYRKASTDVACKDLVEKEKTLIEAKAYGIGVLMVIEAEDVSVSLEMSSAVHLSRTLSLALKSAGLTESSVRLSQQNKGYQLTFILHEGYVIARTWPKYNYCAFDVMLSSKIEKQEATKSHLVAAVGSRTVSSYRIVTGGMLGTGNNDHVGPRIDRSCDQDVEKPATDETISIQQSTMDIILAEAARFIDGQRIGVICGDPSSSCNSLEALANHKLEVVPVWTWPSLVRDASPEMMLDCERDTLANLMEMVNATKQLSGIVVDPQIPHAMGQVLHKILSNDENRRELLEEEHVVLALSTDLSEALWRRALLDRFRTDFVRFGPSYRAEVLFNQTTLELGVFSSGNDEFYSILMKVVGSIEAKTELSADVRNIKNGINNYVADFVPSKMTSHEDYESSLALEQWNSQRALGEQTLIQFEAAEELTALLVKDALNKTLVELTQGNNDFEIETYDTLGDGSVIIGDLSSGSVVLTWDGRRQVSANLFSRTYLDHRHVERLFMAAAQLSITSRNEIPRGIGRVVNFASDVETEAPLWAI